MKTTRQRRERRTTRVADVAAQIERFAPLALADARDKVGLAVGSGRTAVRAVMLSLEADAAALEEAYARGAQMLVCHHPPTLCEEGAIDLDAPCGRIVSLAVRRRVAVYCAHTNLDSAVGGTADVLAGLIGLADVKPLVPLSPDDLVKLVVFVPDRNLSAVWRAVTGAGAGVIGEYDRCTWRCAGRGTFRGSDKSAPAIGRPGKDEEVEEHRLESVVPRSKLGRVVAALRAAHLYEEPAFDVYPLESVASQAGAGRIGVLAEAQTLGALAGRIKRALGVRNVRLTRAATGRVRRVALCTGSGASLLGAAAAAGAQVFVTGEIKYHQALAARDAGLSVIEAGHYATEQPVLAPLGERLAVTFPEVKVSVFKGRGEPQEIV